MTLEGLDGLIKGLESQESWQTQKQFRLALLHWPKSVGFAVARVTRPIGIQRGSLHVATSTAAWAQTLSYERLNILRKLNRHQRIPLKTIRFSTAQWAQAPSNPSQTPERLTQHPSYIGNVPHLPKKLEDAARSPQAAFQQWASTIQQMQITQALCPRCRCHCPSGELERWGICALCAAKQWQ